MKKLAVCFLLALTVSCIEISVNNIHNGFKYVVEGVGKPENDWLIIHSPKVSLDTLTSTINLSQLFITSETEFKIKVSELVAVMDIEEDFNPLVLVTWKKNTEINIGFSIDEDEERGVEMYEMLRSKCLPSFDEL